MTGEIESEVPGVLEAEKPALLDGFNIAPGIMLYITEDGRVQDTAAAKNLHCGNH